MLGEHPLVFEKKVKKSVRTFELPHALAPLADTHAHLTCFWSKDPAEALTRAALAGVRRLVTLYDPVADAAEGDGGLALPGATAFSLWLQETIERARGMLEAYVAQEGDTAPRMQVRSRSQMTSPALPSERVAPSSGASGQARMPDCPAWFGVDWGSPFSQLANPSTLFDNISYLVGVHPYGAPEYTDALHAQIAAALDDPQCAGIGEIGLDYHFDHDDNVAPAPHALQIEVMARQLDLAVRRNVPVELHLRNDDGDAARTAHADAHRVLREVGVPKAGCVLHCFGEDRATMERFVDLGCHIAFGGAATFKRNEGVREAFAACPLDRILFETDCPYMAPEPLRGLECEPAMIVQTARTLIADRARRAGEDEVAIARAVWDASAALFCR